MQQVTGGDGSGDFQVGDGSEWIPGVMGFSDGSIETSLRKFGG